MTGVISALGRIIMIPTVATTASYGAAGILHTGLVTLGELRGMNKLTAMSSKSQMETRNLSETGNFDTNESFGKIKRSSL